MHCATSSALSHDEGSHDNMPFPSNGAQWYQDQHCTHRLSCKTWVRGFRQIRIWIITKFKNWQGPTLVVTKRTGGTTKHQRQYHARCCNGHQTHSMQHGAQPVVWIHLSHDILRPLFIDSIVLYYCLLFRALCMSISAFSDVRVRTFVT